MDSVPLTLYLTAEGGLSTENPKEKQTITYKVDPANPVPTVGGRNLFLPSGPADQRAIESRDDVRVFTSEPLQDDLEITGELLAKITFESDCCDGDIALRLTDVYPDGRSVLIADGLTRTAHATPYDARITSRQIDVDLWSTSIVIAKGHRIRLSVAGSNYPKYELNRHVGLTGANTPEHKIAENSVDTGGESPSVLILPVVRNGTQCLQPNCPNSI